MELFIRDQATILGDAEARLRDTGNARWTDAEIYRALNDALLTWHGRVSVPNVYTISGGWVSGDPDYALPSYINSKTIIPQMRRTIPYALWGQVSVDDSLTWVDVPGWTIEPDGSGGTVLRFDITPYSTEGRVLWFGVNGPVPTTVPTTSGSTAADATSMVLGSAVDCLDHGYVKANGEWIQYSGVTRAAATTTLLNLVRGVPGGIAAGVINTATSVYWGVAMPRLELYRVLLDQTFVFLHELYLTDAAPRETQVHQQMVGFYQGRIDKFWRSWVPMRKPRVIIDRRFITVG